jgi:hypothetical protein
MAGPGGISCWGQNLAPHRGDFAAESSFSRKVQSQSAEHASCWLPGRPASRPCMRFSDLCMQSADLLIKSAEFWR